MCYIFKGKLASCYLIKHINMGILHVLGVSSLFILIMTCIYCVDLCKFVVWDFEFYYVFVSLLSSFYLFLSEKKCNFLTFEHKLLK